MTSIISNSRSSTTLNSSSVLTMVDAYSNHIQYPLICSDLHVDLTDPRTVQPLIYKVFPAWVSAPVILEGFDNDNGDDQHKVCKHESVGMYFFFFCFIAILFFFYSMKLV